ncbi:MAG: ABC transporter substrate-binding protein [Actinomycetota bacterium]
MRALLCFPRARAGCVRYLFMNVSSRPFGSTHVRRGIAALVRRARITPAEASAAVRILPALVTGHGGAAEIPEDLQGARASLQAAGLTDGFSTTLVVGDSARDRREAGAVRASLARAGIRVRVKVVGAGTLHRRYYERDGAAPMGIATWCADFPGLAGAGVLKGVLAYSGDDAASNEIRSARAVAGSAAAEAWRVAETAVLRSAVVVPLYWPADLVGLSNRLSGYVPAPMWVAGDPANVWVGPQAPAASAS